MSHRNHKLGMCSLGDFTVLPHDRAENQGRQLTVASDLFFGMPRGSYTAEHDSGNIQPREWLKTDTSKP